MAAVLRSSVIQTVRHALSGEGTLSVRALHTGRNNRKLCARCAKRNLKTAEVDPLFKNIDDTARKEMVAGYFERLLWKLNKNPSLLRKVVNCWFSITTAGVCTLGYQSGASQAQAESKALSGMQA